MDKNSRGTSSILTAPRTLVANSCSLLDSMKSTPSMSRSIAESRNSPNKRGWAESTKEPRPPGSPAPHHRNRDRHKDLPRQKRSEVVSAKAATLRSPCTTDETERSDFGRRRSTTNPCSQPARSLPWQRASLHAGAAIETSDAPFLRLRKTTFLERLCHDDQSLEARMTGAALLSIMALPAFCQACRKRKAPPRAC